MPETGTAHDPSPELTLVTSPPDPSHVVSLPVGVSLSLQHGLSQTLVYQLCHNTFELLLGLERLVRILVFFPMGLLLMRHKSRLASFLW